MLRICEIRMLLLILSLPTNIKSTKVLSDKKKCGDPECETSMSRVQAIKDYTGPDCRYLNFKTGEEIIVYFKLSRTREDLWAGSKGTDFGYFPMDAVQTEEVFITKEIEVPTKETDFLCLDGGNYVFENEESVLNQPDEGYEHIFLHTDEKDSEFKMTKDEFQKHRSILSIKEYKEAFPEKYEFVSDSKDFNSLEITSHKDSKFKESETGQDEIIQLEQQNSQTLKSVPTPSTWTISNFADWFGLENRENKEVFSKIPETTEEITFRGRKITVTEDDEFKKLNEEGETEPKTSGWFQSTLTDLLHYGSKKSGLDLLYKENNPKLYDSSTVAGNIDVHSESEIRQEGHRDSEHSGSEPSESNWFDLGLSNVLTFGYSKENMVKETLSGRENVDHDAKPSAQNAQSTLTDEHTRKQIDETVPFEEQNKEKYNEDTSKETVEATSKEDEKYEQKENADLNEADASVSIDSDMTVKHSSELGNQVMENINTKAITTESKRRSDQSGWYGGFGFKRGTSDNEPGHESVIIEWLQESTEDNFLPSHSIGRGFDPTVTQSTREENQEDPQKQSFFSISYFTNILNFQGFITKENINVQHADKELKFGQESSQGKKGDKNIFNGDKEGKEQILLKENVIEKLSENMYVSTSEVGKLVSSSITISNEENRIKTQDDESAQKQAPPNLSGKSKSKYRLANGECIQLHWNCTLESLEIQAHSNPEDKHSAHNPEVREASFSQLGNRVNSPDKQHYIRKDVYNQEIKLVDTKSMESLSPAAMKDNFCVNNNYHHGEVDGTVIAKEGMNKFPKEGEKEQKSFSEHIVENIQGCCEHSAEDDAVKQTNEKDVNMLNEGLPPGTTPLEVFQNEKDTSEHGSHMQIYNYVTDTIPKNEIQGSEVQIDGKGSEEVNDLKTTEHFVKAQVSDSSLTAKVIYGHSLHTFSKEGIHSSQMSPSLTYKKMDEQKLKGEQKVSTSHHKISDTETFSSPKFEDSYRKNSNFLSLGPKEKSISQMVPDSKTHLIVDTEMENLRISTQINDIANSEDSQSKFHQRSMDTMPNLLGVTSQKKAENSLKTTDNDNLLQEQINVPKSIFSENTVLHSEVQSDTDININPSKLSSHDNPQHFKTLDRHMEQIPPYSKDGLDIYYSVVDTNDEPFACDRFPFLPNNLNHAEEIACSQHARGSKEKGSKDIETEKETEHKDVHDGNNKRAEESIMSNQESTKNKDSRNITNQIRAERQEADIISDFEQDKHKVQITEITTDFDNFTIKEHRSEVQAHSTEEKSATADSKKDSQKDIIPVVQKTEPVFPETVQNYKLIIDTELDIQVTTDFWELYSKLTEESKRGSQAHLCERHQFQQIEQELEKLRHGIITFPREDICRETRQMTTSVEYEPKLNTGHEQCWKNKMDLFLELQSLVLDIRNKCEDRNAESDEKPNNGQHVEAKHIPTENMEKKIHTSLKNGQHQQDLEEKLPGGNLIQDYVLSNEGWLFQIILHLNDFCTFIASGFSVMTSVSEKSVAPF